jgi:hypothetical protein
MNNTLKIGLGLAFAGALLYAFNNSAAVINAVLNYKIKGYGTPKLDPSTWILQLPVKVEFNNNTPVPVNLDKITADISLWNGTTFIKVGQISQPLSIASGKSNAVIVPAVDLKPFFKKDFLTTALTALNTKKLFLKTDATVQYGQQQFAETFQKEISLA